MKFLLYIQNTLSKILLIIMHIIKYKNSSHLYFLGNIHSFFVQSVTDRVIRLQSMQRSISSDPKMIRSHAENSSPGVHFFLSTFRLT